jgi:uncharacterized protein involved in response to NO
VAQYHRTLPTTPRDILTIPPKGPTRSDRKGWADQQKPHAHKPTIKITGNRARPTSVHQWIQAKHQAPERHPARDRAAVRTVVLAMIGLTLLVIAMIASYSGACAKPSTFLAVRSWRC